MSEKKSQLQRNENQHRKLIRSPEKVSPCELDSSFNPSFLSTTAKRFANQTKSSPLPDKYSKDQFSPNQQVLQNNIFSTIAHETTGLCPSLTPPSSTSFTCRKPSIIRTYSNSDGNSLNISPSLVYNQSSIDLNHLLTNTTTSTRINTDQTSNNIINVNSVPGCCLQINANLAPCKNVPSLENQSNKLSLLSFKNELCSSNVPPTSDTCQQKDPTFYHSPVSESLNLSLMSQFNVNPKVDTSVGKFVFNSNNPFLNDTLDTNDDDKSGDKCNASFFNIDALQESGTTFFNEDSLIGDCDDQLLKNKREKFSNASKICLLVVSPPTNKLFQVSISFFIYVVNIVIS